MPSRYRKQLTPMKRMIHLMNIMQYSVLGFVESIKAVTGPSNLKRKRYAKAVEKSLAAADLYPEDEEKRTSTLTSYVQHRSF